VSLFLSAVMSGKVAMIRVVAEGIRALVPESKVRRARKFSSNSASIFAGVRRTGGALSMASVRCAAVRHMVGSHHEDGSIYDRNDEGRGEV